MAREASKLSRFEGHSVAVVIRAHGGYLMQLRDDDDRIVFPGCWGFFAGTIERGERPLDAALRELREELDWVPAGLRPLGADRLDELGGLTSYGFACRYDGAPFRLREGLDAAVLADADLERGSKLSSRTGREHPVIPIPYVRALIERARLLLEKSR